MYNKGVMFGKPRYNKEKGVALCYSSRVVVTKNYREFRINELKKEKTNLIKQNVASQRRCAEFENENAIMQAKNDKFEQQIKELKFPRSFSLVSPIISKSHLEKNRIIDKMLRRL